MSIRDKVTQLEKRIEKLAERRDVPLQPVEIRKAALDEIEDLVEPAGRSRFVFPYNHVTVEVVADAKQRAAMQSVLGEDSDIIAAVAERLQSAGCPTPRGLNVQLKVVRRMGPDWETGRVFRVLCERTDVSAQPGRPAGAVGATMTVLKGDATRRSVTLTGERSNIGRLPEVLDKDKRVIRRNQVVFTDNDSAVNQTVSRAHAHVAVSESGEWRLFDDRSTYGTRIFRDGRTIALPSGSPRGAKLQSGDEIYFGQACVRFVVSDAAKGAAKRSE